MITGVTTPPVPSSPTVEPAETAPGPVRRAVRTAFGGLPGQFWFQWAGTLVNRLGMFVQPFLVLYLTDVRGLSTPQAGLLIAGWGAGAMIGPLVGGWLADRIGRRATMTGAMVAAALSLAGLGAARSIPMIAVTAFLAGVAADMYRPAASALVADVVQAKDQARAFGLLFWAVNLGFSVSAAAGGYLASAGYGWLFAADAVTCAVFGALIWFGVPRDTRPERTAQATGGGYLTALRDPVVLGLLGLCLLFAVVYNQAYVTLPLAVRDAGLPTSAYGAVIALNGIVIVVAQPFVGGWLQRFRPSLVMASAAAVLCVGFAATGLAGGVLGFGVSVVIWTLGEIGMAGTAQVLAASLAPPHARGRYQGLFTLSWAAAALFGPIAGTGLYAGAGPAALWSACLVAGAVLAVGFVALGRSPRLRG